MLNRTLAMAGIVLMGTYCSAQDIQTSDANGQTRLQKGSQLVGKAVVDSQDESIGEISEMIMDRTGKIRYAILRMGGVVGVGSDYIAVPVAKLTQRVPADSGDWTYELPMDKETVERAPKLEDDQYRELASANWVRTNDEFFNAGEGTESPSVISRPEMFRVAKIIGTAVVGENADEADLGGVTDLIFDQGHQLRYAILGEGGVLGIGKDYIAVPTDALTLRFDADDDRVTVSVRATEQELESAPRITSDNYQELMDATYRSRLNEYYKIDGDTIK